MPFRTRCPYCAKEFKAKDSFLGRRMACKGCGERFVVKDRDKRKPPATSKPTNPTADAFPTGNQDRAIGDESGPDNAVDAPYSVIDDSSACPVTLELSVESGVPAAVPSHLPPEKHEELGRECMVDWDYEGAARHFRHLVWALLGNEEPRDALHDSLKIRYWWTRFFRHIGLQPPGALTKKNLFAKVWGWIVFVLVPAISLKLMKDIPDLRGVLWPLVSCLALVFLTGRAADYAATIRLWSTEDRRPALSGGDLAGAICGIVLITAAMICAIVTGVSGNMLYAAAAFFSFLAARPMQLALKTRAGFPRGMMLAYVIVFFGCGMGSLWCLVSAGVTGMSMEEKLPRLAGWLVFAHIGGLLLTGPMRAVLLDLCGSGESFLDHSTSAETPGGIHLSDAKLRRFHPELYGVRSLFHRIIHWERFTSAKDAREMVRQHIMHGDSRAAVVISTSPLLVAAYSDDLDGVALLEFDSQLAKEHGLSRGSRLLLVNTYFPMEDRDLGLDLILGPEHTNMWGNVTPFIAEFLSDDSEKIQSHKREIDEMEWEKTLRLGDVSMSRPTVRPRDGRPLVCHLSRAVLEDG